MPESKEAAPATTVAISEDDVELALRGQLEVTADLAIEDPQVVAIGIIERILASEDADAVFGGQQAVGGREVLDRPFTLYGARWHRSRFEEATVPVFAVLDAHFLDTGERF